MTEIADERRLSSPEWLMQPAYEGVIVLDPDGWDRKNFAASWAERITESEFNRRLVASTCQIPISLIQAALSTPPRTDAAGVTEEMYKAGLDAAHRSGYGNPSFDLAVTKGIDAALASRPAPSEEYKLPCDVHLPPNTFLRRGVSLETLMSALERRRGSSYDATVFPLIASRPAPSEDLQTAAREWAEARGVVCRSAIGSPECHEAVTRLGHAEDRLSRLVLPDREIKPEIGAI